MSTPFFPLSGNKADYKGTSSMSALVLLSSSSSTVALRGWGLGEGPSSTPSTSLVPAGPCLDFSAGFSSPRAFAGTASPSCLGGGVGGTSGPGSPTTGLSVTGLFGVPLLGRFDGLPLPVPAPGCGLATEEVRELKAGLAPTWRSLGFASR